MGQYWVPVNIDRKETLNPFEFGCGLKLGEQFFCEDYLRALMLLITAMPERRGGGDLDEDDEKYHVIGRWAGDRVLLIGDYAEEEDLIDKGVEFCDMLFYFARSSTHGSNYITELLKDETDEKQKEYINRAYNHYGEFTDISHIVLEKINLLKVRYS